MPKPLAMPGINESSTPWLGRCNGIGGKKDDVLPETGNQDEKSGQNFQWMDTYPLRPNVFNLS